ncbi:DOMON domain-containing protein CG14681 [Caligus rogercresseyi]|uniref:DOMON domain-containing protein CG14681 n=1 Tax=Caligus rogercresseyi TaxID=217165 RepID=A0A7T8K9T2_CALRO|nr:DOMON domain-containing protein CG14681 [Caligus rogercresseyi]|eukprot:TRINITY_DN439_c0_g1_i1.p1 TRINITY_DN439_c0_g1~~TRINITY_DN439_c0_g1_i1.p1  ORF type:complete len:217 (-),score=70.39 TRINITY_DN439_c0_g1_i1:226-876(-)
MIVISVLISCLCLSVSAEIIKIGDIATKGHGVKGTISVYNASTIIVENFEYDGGAPDAFFMVGDTDKPTDGGTLLPYPFEGKFYEYSDDGAPIIQGVHNGSRMVLTLPSDAEVSDFKWFAVWCRAYSINFGDVYFPESFDLSGEPEPEGGDDIPSPIAPVSNDISGEKDHEYHHGDHSDAESEAESHAEHEPQPGSGHTFIPSALLMAALFSLLKL